MPSFPEKYKEIDKWFTILCAACIIFFAFNYNYYGIGAITLLDVAIHFLLQWHNPI